MDKKYWNEYYKKDLVEKKPSLFAQFVLEKYLKKGKEILELGCGNGRDSLYFAENGLIVTSIDGAESAIQQLEANVKLKNINFVVDDFVNTKIFEKNFDYIYSRFTMHAINDEEQKKVINNVYQSLKSEGLFFIEVRSVKDELFQKGEKVGRNAFFYDEHYRRFLVKDELKMELEEVGFQIMYEAEERNFAPHGSENPYIIRIIAKKQKM